ncbi:MAG: hypothetical protein RL021_2179, partial [Bacteroidota bacterium]
FFAKYFVFTAALDAGYTGLVLIAVVGSLIGVYYYFRPLMAVFGAEQEGHSVELPRSTAWILVLMAIFSVVLGIYPGLLSGLAL